MSSQAAHPGIPAALRSVLSPRHAFSQGPLARAVQLCGSSSWFSPRSRSTDLPYQPRHLPWRASWPSSHHGQRAMMSLPPSLLQPCSKPLPPALFLLLEAAMNHSVSLVIITKFFLCTCGVLLRKHRGRRRTRVCGTIFMKHLLWDKQQYRHHSPTNTCKALHGCLWLLP